VIFSLRPAQEVKSNETTNAFQEGITRGPDFFEVRLCAERNFETIHRDEHVPAPEFGPHRDALSLTLAIERRIFRGRQRGV
jgi:hypothetical protein